MQHRVLVSLFSLCLSLLFCSGQALAEEQKSIDQIAKELANPASAMASLSLNLQYTEFTGDLPKSDDQASTSLIFQPTLPFPVGDKGQNIIFRPALSVLFDQPLYDPDKRDFDSADVNLADTGFDLVFAGTVMTNKEEKRGYLYGVGLAGTIPTASDDDLGGEQWRFGPEIFGGILRNWGLVGALVSNQWDVGGSNDEAFSTTTAQYFYAYGLGNGWQISSSPVASYDWQADSDEALTLPLGVGVSKTTVIGNQPWKFQFQVQKFVVQPDTFGPDWLVKFTVTPVIKNPFVSFYR